MNEPVLVDANPLFKRGPFAVWRICDIPVGITRFVVAETVKGALTKTTFAWPTITQTGADRYSSHLFAAVLWGYLQPMHPIPRGRSTMAAEHWGNDRDCDGVCCVCGVDDSMWCDKAVHGKLWLAAAYHDAKPLSAPSPRDRRPSAVIRAEFDSIRMHTGHKFSEVDASRCLKCALKAELDEALEAEAVLGPWVEAPLEPTYTPSNGAARLMIAGMEAKNGEHTVRRAISDQARDAWAAALRAKVKAGEEADRERERTRVLVDLHFEPWE